MNSSSRKTVVFLLMFPILGCSQQSAFLELCKLGSLVGNSAANYQLAKYNQDNGEIQQAMEYAIKAAEDGHIQAQYEVGMFFFMEKDYKQAAFWMIKVFDNQTDDEDRLWWQMYASQNLGQLYGYGRGVPKDEEKALEYFHFAASKGVEDSKKFLSQVEQIGFQNAMAECWPWREELVEGR